MSREHKPLKRGRPAKYTAEEKEQKYKEQALNYYYDHRDEICQKRLKKNKETIDLAKLDVDVRRQIEQILNTAYPKVHPLVPLVQ